MQLLHYITSLQAFHSIATHHSILGSQDWARTGAVPALLWRWLYLATI